jgi:ABC-type dipeptide/oligopeptide/nickel transport system permease subunit
MSRLDWRWIGIGTLIMFGLNLLAALVILPLLGGAQPVSPDTASADAVADVGAGRLLLAALLSFASFAVGGYIVGTRSAGRTVVEPAISAAIAVAISLLIGGAFTLGNLLAGGLVPFLAGLLGGWLGERRQRGTAAPLS